MATKSVTGLKRLYRGNNTAKLLLDYFAGRDRNRVSTNFNRVLSVLAAQDVPPSRARLREVFRTLERLGYGKFVVGRRGRPTRFVWSSSLIETGEAAQVPVKHRAVKPKATKGTMAARAKRGPALAAKRGPGRPRKNEAIAA